MIILCPNKDCAELVEVDLQEESGDRIRYAGVCDGENGCLCEFEVTYERSHTEITMEAPVEQPG